MKPNSLANWAAFSEIVASICVVTSMVFLAYSVRENTAALEAAEERAFLAAWRDVSEVPFYTDAELASIQLKVHSGEELTPLEARRWWNYLRALFDTWWQFYNAYADGLTSETALREMDRSTFTVWERERMGEFWLEMRKYWAGAAFAKHIDKAVARMSRPGNEKDR